MGIRRDDAPEQQADGAALVAPDRVPAWSRLTADPAPVLGLPSFTQHDDAAAELGRRERIFAAAQERYYERPRRSNAAGSTT